MTQLSQHFSLEELVRTSTGLSNVPGEMELEHLRETAEQMESVRALLGHPIIVDSGYRSPEVNMAVRGVSTSAHCKGYAVDFTCPGYGTPQEIARRIIGSSIEFDQAIWEKTWCHISFAPELRRQALTAHIAGGKPTFYTPGVA